MVTAAIPFNTAMFANAEILDAVEIPVQNSPFSRSAPFD